MLYLGIDQHARQITVSLRDEKGDVQLARQVSTRSEKINAFFEQLTRDRFQNNEPFVAVLEVCGFNDWLIRMLYDYRCQQVILIQPDEKKNHKTDRRDTAALSEQAVGQPRAAVRRQAGSRAAAGRSRFPHGTRDRRLTTLRKEAGKAKTRIINRIKNILRRHNLQWEMPTKTRVGKAAIAWLKELSLPAIDRLEVDQLLADLERSNQRIQDLDAVIAERCEASDEARVLTSLPGTRAFTATALACRVGRVERFRRGRSLANDWGLTPGCRNSGEKKQRLGRITKAGSSMARWLLARIARHALRVDRGLREWFKRIKRRRGASIARVAVMRKLATIIWQMLSKQMTYHQVRAFAAA